MKISLLLLTSLFFLAACKKEESNSPNTFHVTSISDAPVLPGPMPYNASFKIKLVLDASHSDEIDFVFRQNYSLAYVFNEDVLHLTGTGQASLSSISSDGRDLAINGLPYSKGMLISLNASTIVNKGTFYLEKSYESNVPSNIHVWLKDAYLKDSVDIFKKKYNFKMKKTDTNSFGSKRFKLVLKYTGQ
jgi:hypothetical protein